MNNIRQIQELNKRELENGVFSPDASWHADFRDSAYIYIGGLPFEFSEGDIITIFSQYGEPTYVNLVRDKETGKSRGFAFLKYEDQRSTDLAVDNLGGTTIINRMIRVDHTRYRKKEGEVEEDQNAKDLCNETGTIEDEDGQTSKWVNDTEHEAKRPMLKEERKLAALIKDHDDDDPMKLFLIQERKEQVSAALAQLKDSKGSGTHHKRRHHHHSHRSRETDEHESNKRHPRRRRDEYRSHKSRLKDCSTDRDAKDNAASYAEEEL